MKSLKKTALLKCTLSNSDARTQVPKQFQKHVCSSCSRFMHQHRRTAVRESKHVLAGIDAGGGATEILSPDEIWGGLYLSGQRAVNETLFREKNIEMCVTVAKDLDRNGFKGFRRRRNCAARATNAKILELEWKDTTSQKIEWEDLEHAVEFIDRGRREGRNVLVHCAAGQSRSVTVVLSYLCAYARRGKTKPKPFNIDRALSFVTKRRPSSNPNEGFRTQLRKFTSKFKAIRLKDPHAGDRKGTSSTSSVMKRKSVVKKGNKVVEALALLGGDSLQEPFWPEGLGLNRGFMSAYDNTWIVKSMMKRKSGMEALRDLRERMYVAMRDVSSRDAKSVFTSGVIKGDTSLWSADPSTRYRGFA